MDSDKSTSTNIHSIDELVTALSDGERATFNEIARSFDIPISEFENFCSWSEDGYTRNCVFENEEFELILLCWEPGQKTPIHDHGGEECWVKAVKGEFEEVIYKMDENDALKLVKSDISKTNDITYMIDFMGFHSLQNISNERSMSLHLYAKPIKNCNSYCEDAHKLINRELVDSTVPASVKN
ncbi:MAG: cysteine dioxygenase family protein [Crocinitomicaceae bacterium]|nr:cysteine dioxygenase family protein [Crocinitomicaceae bacterium]